MSANWAAGEREREREDVTIRISEQLFVHHTSCQFTNEWKYTINQSINQCIFYMIINERERERMTIVIGTCCGHIKHSYRLMQLTPTHCKLRLANRKKTPYTCQLTLWSLVVVYEWWCPWCLYLTCNLTEKGFAIPHQLLWLAMNKARA